MLVAGQIRWYPLRMNALKNDRDAINLEGRLRDVGLRVTRQRVAVLEVLLQAGDHPTVEEVFLRAREHDPSMSLATAYRTLSAFVEGGMVRKLSMEDAPARYEMMPQKDHEHLLDVDTGALTELFSEELESARKRLLDQFGYELVSYHSVIRARRKTPEAKHATKE